MAYSKIKNSTGQKVVRIKTAEGRIYEFRSLSTKPLDPKLKAEGKIRAKAMREKFQNAVKIARRKKLSLQQVVPVS